MLLNYFFLSNHNKYLYNQKHLMNMEESSVGYFCPPCLCFTTICNAFCFYNSEIITKSDNFKQMKHISLA